MLVANNRLDMPICYSGKVRHRFSDSDVHSLIARVAIYVKIGGSRPFQNLFVVNALPMRSHIADPFNK